LRARWTPGARMGCKAPATGAGLQVRLYAHVDSLERLKAKTFGMRVPAEQSSVPASITIRVRAIVESVVY
jgi:hypothetical protein